MIILRLSWLAKHSGLNSVLAQFNNSRNDVRCVYTDFVTGALMFNRVVYIHLISRCNSGLALCIENSKISVGDRSMLELPSY